MHIVTKDVRDLTDYEYYICLRNNYGVDWGYMNSELKDAREGRTAPAKAVMIWTDKVHDRGDKMIAWALLTPTKTSGLTAVTPYIKRNSKYTAQFWVKARHRRKGYGTMLLKHIKRYHDPMPHVVPHDEASGELFSKFKVRTLGEDKCYLKNKPKVA